MRPLSPGALSFFQSFRAARKGELHLHLEGSISTATLVRLSTRFRDPAFPSEEEVRRRRSFDGPGAFFELYRDVCRCLKSPADYADVGRDLARRLRRERIAYAEVYVSPAVIERIGLSWLEVQGALETAFGEHEAAGAGRIVVLLDSVRQWGPEAASRVLDLHEASPWPRVAGFGLGGDETAVPAREFRRVFDRVRALSLAPLIHAGEWGGPDGVAEAVETLKPARIAHGIRAVEDDAVVRLLARRQVPLDICIASNVATKAVPDGRSHPVLRLLRSGVPVSLSTDDPGLFRTTLRGEFLRLARLGASESELRTVLAASRSGALRPFSLPGRARRSRGTSPPWPRR